MTKTFIVILATVTILLTSSCGNYYQKLATFNKCYEQGNYEEARKYLEEHKRLKEKKNTEILYYLNHGMVCHLAGDYETSIASFNEADRLVEEYKTNIGLEAAALLTNPNVTPYKPETFEPVLLHFYQALNYIAINKYEDAIVECKKMDEWLSKTEAEAKRSNTENHYVQDAFGHYTMGLIYEASRDYNNAFIAYRNAYNIYNGAYTKLFNTLPPEGLKQSLLRSASRTGFNAELHQYEKEFKTVYKEESEKGHLIVFVQQGLSPIKTEKSINMTRVGTQTGIVNFADETNSFNIPIPLPNVEEKSKGNSINLVRITMPEYTDRLNYQSYNITQAEIDNEKIKLETAENIGLIAKQALRDRVWAEMGKAILRAIAKQAAVMAVRKDDSKNALGSLLNIGLAIAEKPDTRHWQSLPNKILLIDKLVPSGEHTIKVTNNGTVTERNVSVKNGSTTFVIF